MAPASCRPWSLTPGPSRPPLRLCRPALPPCLCSWASPGGVVLRACVVTSEELAAARGRGWLTCPVRTGKVKKELDHDDGHLHLDETTKLLQDLHEAQAERGGSRPSSNLSSLSNASDRDQQHLGEGSPPGLPQALGVSLGGGQQLWLPGKVRGPGRPELVPDAVAPGSGTMTSLSGLLRVRCRRGARSFGSPGVGEPTQAPASRGLWSGAEQGPGSGPRRPRGLRCWRCVFPPSILIFSPETVVDEAHSSRTLCWGGRVPSLGQGLPCSMHVSCAPRAAAPSGPRRRVPAPWEGVHAGVRWAACPCCCVGFQARTPSSSSRRWTVTL